MRLVFTSMLIAIAVLVIAEPAAALPGNARITTAGLGPVKIGMTERQVERAGNRRIRLRQGGSPGCYTATLGSKLWGLFSAGRRLARIYVDSARYPTRSGIRVGDTEAEVLATYPGELLRESHAYLPGGWYLKILDGNRRVVFEVTGGGRVTSISTGRKPEIDYVEGCS